MHGLWAHAPASPSSSPEHGKHLEPLSRHTVGFPVLSLPQVGVTGATLLLGVSHHPSKTHTCRPSWRPCSPCAFAVGVCLCLQQTHRQGAIVGDEWGPWGRGGRNPISRSVCVSPGRHGTPTWKGYCPSFMHLAGWSADVLACVQTRGLGCWGGGRDCRKKLALSTEPWLCRHWFSGFAKSRHFLEPPWVSILTS